MTPKDDKKFEDLGKKRPTSFDAMVRLFLQYYRIPTRKDIEKLMDRIDRLEKLLRTRIAETGKMRGRGRKAEVEGGRENMTASDQVVEVISEAGDEGISFALIKEKTGFEDKKLRNIIFRLNRLGRIQRKSRGVYRVP
ncbi:MAG: hypothetical protein ACLFOY_07470 [Desulfatibacillaceae bacterium]